MCERRGTTLLFEMKHIGSAKCCALSLPAKFFPRAPALVDAKGGPSFSIRMPCVSQLAPHLQQLCFKIQHDVSLCSIGSKALASPSTTMTPSPGPSVGDLPTELKLAVLEELYRTDSERDIANALRMCKEWNELGTPVLWTNIPINNENLLPFVR